MIPRNDLAIVSTYPGSMNRNDYRSIDDNDGPSVITTIRVALFHLETQSFLFFK